ncbi:hypothetical protein ACFZAD_24585 [Streptomyces iakyrus]|uniref:hypothetical protein n=1 Tax=Streptomyces iakyrus TaxID=68219 RepID=UPI0036EC86EA
MAVTATNLTTDGSNIDAATYMTASISPTADSLLLAWVYTIAGSAPNIPTVSGNGLTWTQVATVIDSNNLRRLTLFRAMGTSPSTGEVTFNFGGQTQAGCVWSVVKYSGVDTSGTNGSGAIVQSATQASGGVVNNLTVTLSAFSNSLHGTAGGFGYPLNNGNGVPGTGFTQTGERFQGSPNQAILSEFGAGEDVTVDLSLGASSVPIVGIAVEIKLAPQQVAPISIDSAEAFGLSSVTPGSVTINPTSIESEEAFGDLTVTGTLVSIVGATVLSAKSSNTQGHVPSGKSVLTNHPRVTIMRVKGN